MRLFIKVLTWIDKFNSAILELTIALTILGLWNYLLISLNESR